MGSGIAKPDYVAHIQHGLKQAICVFLEIGWAMTRIVETGGHQQSGSLDSFIAEHLPLTPNRAHRAGTAWAAVAALLRADKHPVDQSDDWQACRLLIDNVLPELTTEGALVSFRPVIERPVPLMLKVWHRSVELSKQTDTKELTARQVNSAKREVLSEPAKPVHVDPPEPHTSEDVPRGAEESPANLSDRALGHLTRQVRDTCQAISLIPEVATAIIEGAAIRQIANDVDSAKSRLEKILDQEICSQLEAERILSLLGEAHRKLLYGKPFAPCPHCWQVGRTTENCTGCQPSLGSKPLGWVNRNKWGSAGEQTRKGPS